MRSFIGKVSSSGRRARLVSLAALLSLALVGWGVASLASAEHSQAQAADTTTLTIRKLNMLNGANGDANEVFTGTYTGPVSGTFSITAGTPYSVVLPLGNYTVTEDTPTGSTALGGFVNPGNECNTQEGPGRSVPGAVSITLVAVSPIPQEVCLVNARRTLTIRKLNMLNGAIGDANEVFTGTYTGPVSGTFSVTGNSPFTRDVPTGNYTVTEDTPTGSTPLGGFAFPSECNTQEGPGRSSPGPVNIILVPQTFGTPSPQVCLVNARRTLTIRKLNMLNGAIGDANEVFTGTYTGPVSGTFSVTGNSPFTRDVPTGTYTVTENTPTGSTPLGGFAFPSECNTQEGPGRSSPGPITITLVPQTFGTPSPQVCLVNARRTLTIRKLNILNGANGDGTEVFTGTYTGPVSGTFSVTANTPWTHDVPTGNYTVAEDTPTGSTPLGGFVSINGTSGCNRFEGIPSAVPGPVNITLIPQFFPAGQEVCLLNARGTLRIEKVFLGGNPAQVFTGTYSGPVTGAFSVSQNAPFAADLPTGTYTVTEDVELGVGYVGGFVHPSASLQCNSTSAPGQAAPGPVTQTLSPHFLAVPSGVCLVNEPVSEVVIVKHDDVDADHGGNTGQWQFSIDGGAEGFAVVGVPRADGTTQTVSHKFGTNPASGTVMELAGNPTACFDQVVKSYETHVGSPGNPGVAAPFSSTPGTQAEVHFYNVDCGKVLGAGTLDVIKFNDLDGDKTQDPGETELAWEVTVSCPGQPDRVATTPAHFTGLPNNTTCTVTETPAADHRVIGWRASDVGTATGEVTSDGTGVTTFVHVDDGDALSVTFYNQPRVNVRVHKRELLPTGVANGQGWAITVTGCGVNQTVTTGSDGAAAFSDLPPCTFTVSEKIDSKPGFGPVAPASVQVVAMLAGETAGVTFTNVSLAGICTVCSNLNPTTTPIPTAPPPTATQTPPPAATQTPPTASATIPPSTQQPATATPTRTPTTSAGTQATGLTDEQRTATAVAGARTASAQQSTPIAPRTGGGAMDGAGGTLNLALLAAALVALSSGLGLAAVRGRRR